jgi:hypothetical protein
LNDFVVVILQLGHLAANAPQFIFQRMDAVIGIHQVIVLLLQPETSTD